MATGTSTYHQDENFKAEKVIDRGTVATVTTAGNATYTPAQVLGGTIVRDPAGSARTDSLPTAVNLVAAVPKAKIGDTIDLFVMNASDSTATTAATELLTIAAGTGGAFASQLHANARTITKGASVLAASSRISSKMVRIRLTEVAPGSQAYVVYM